MSQVARTAIPAGAASSCSGPSGGAPGKGRGTRDSSTIRGGRDVRFSAPPATRRRRATSRRGRDRRRGTRAGRRGPARDDRARHPLKAVQEFQGYITMNESIPNPGQCTATLPDPAAGCRGHGVNPLKTKG